MYYFTYDPWVGKQLYLEDFYVMDEYRGKKSPSVYIHSCSAASLMPELFLFLQVWASVQGSCGTSVM